MYRKNVRGGLVCVYRRHHEVGVSTIRDGPNVCQSLYLFDENALYTHSMSLDLPTGPHSIRIASNNFKLEKSGKFLETSRCVDFISGVLGIPFLHAYNNEKGEFPIGLYPVDGVNIEKKIVVQFDGSFYHPGHKNCPHSPFPSVNATTAGTCDSSSNAQRHRLLTLAETRRQNTLERDRSSKLRVMTS